MGVRYLLLGGMLLVLLPVAASAQMPSASRSGFKPQFQSKEKNTSREPPPPALPGAVTNSATDTTKGAPIDLPPTDALFDSINRGDMTEARDALARGADLQAQNVLGMTPIALSVDLGRNDITFLLLSYRGGGGSPPPPAAVATEAAPPGKPSRQSAEPLPVTASKAIARTRAPASAQGINAGATHPNMTASGTPGVPVPQSGFLGFGGSAQN